MDPGQTWLPRQRDEGLLTETVGEEIVVLDVRTGSAHCLGGSVARLWELCDGSHGIAWLAEHTNLTREAAEDALAELHDLELISPGPGDDGGGVTRRAVARRGLQVAAGAGLVFSIGVPDAEAAASKLANCAVAPNCTATGSPTKPVADSECASGYCYVLQGSTSKVCVPGNCVGLLQACSVTSPCCYATCSSGDCVDPLVCPGTA